MTNRMKIIIDWIERNAMVDLSDCRDEYEHEYQLQELAYYLGLIEECSPSISANEWCEAL